MSDELHDLQNTARWLHNMGANVTAIEAGAKGPAHVWKHWETQRQNQHDVDNLPWRGYKCKRDDKRHKAGQQVTVGGVGVINGVGGWHTFDIDAKKDAETKRPIAAISDATVGRLLATLGLPRDYPWVWRSGSGCGWEIAIRCDEPMPVGVLTPDKRESGVFTGWPDDNSVADWHHLELRWETCQTVVACNDGRGYAWRHGQPTEPPALLPVRRVIAAFFDLAPPPPYNLGTIDRAVVNQIKTNFDLVAYFQRELGGDTEPEGHEIRVCGHQGLLVDPEKGIWHIFGEKTGGDAIDAVAYCKYRTTARNLNGKGAEVLSAAAEFAGVTLPDRKPAQTVTITPTVNQPVTDDSQPTAAAPRFMVATEDDLHNLPPLRYLDHELGIVGSASHLIYGASGSGKTFYAIECAMRLAERGLRVLYIPTEDVSGLRYRVAAWRQAHPEATGRLTWLKMPVGLDLQDHRQVGELLDTIEAYQYDLILLDTLREAHSGDENSSMDTARIDRAIQRMIGTGAAVGVVHHTGVAGERPRGSTALFGNADMVVKVENDDGLVRVSFDKIRNGEKRDPIAFGIVQQDTGLLDAEGEPVISAILRPAAQITTRNAKLSPIQRRVLETLALSIFDGCGAKANQVIDTAEITRRNVFLALSTLKNRGYATQGIKGDPYHITSAGRAQLGPDYALRPSDHPDSALEQSSDPVFAEHGPNDAPAGANVRSSDHGIFTPPAASDRETSATPAASDRTRSAPESASDRSDQEVITSDQHNGHSEVITSDHTRRVITGSHADHMDDHTTTVASFPEESLPDDLPAVPSPAGLVARLRELRE